MSKHNRNENTIIIDDDDAQRIDDDKNIKRSKVHSTDTNIAVRPNSDLLRGEMIQLAELFYWKYGGAFLQVKQFVQEIQDATIKEKVQTVLKYSTWEKGEITPTSFLLHLFLLVDEYQPLLSFIFNILNKDNWAINILQSNSGVNDDWQPMTSAWETNPYILAYQKLHPVVFNITTTSTITNSSVSSSSASSKPSQSIAIQWKPQLCVRECGAGGDCLFKVIAWALNKQFGGKKITDKDVRVMAADAVTESNFQLLYQAYTTDNQPQHARLLKKYENAGPLSIEQFRNVISTTRTSYQGDFVTLALLLQSKDPRLYDIGFLVLQQDGTFYNLGEDTNRVHSYYILIYHMIQQETSQRSSSSSSSSSNEEGAEEIEHFRLVGWLHSDGSVQCCFSFQQLPSPLISILKEQIAEHPLSVRQ